MKINNNTRKRIRIKETTGEIKIITKYIEWLNNPNEEETQQG